MGESDCPPPKQIWIVPLHVPPSWQVICSILLCICEHILVAVLFMQCGLTPLHTASKKGHKHVAKVLLDEGAQVDIENKVSLVGFGILGGNVALVPLVCLDSDLEMVEVLHCLPL